MKKILTFISISALAIAVATGVNSIPAGAKSGDGIASQIQRETSPPDRTGPLAGYAEVVRRVSPSVVSIVTSAKVEQRSMQDYEFFFNDPLLRRFFGTPEANPGFRQPMPEQRRQGLGSGVILTSDGYIVTNNHVIDGADEIEVQLKDSRTTFDAEIIGRDPATDLALIKIDAEDLPVATVGDSASLQPGDVVLAIGNPFGLNQTVTTGIVSAVGRRNLSIADYSNFIQTDASINPGNSGGALIDNKGRLVGINTAIFSRSGGNVGIGFAIPTNMAVEVLDRLSTDGEVKRGYLGVTLSDLTPELAEGFGVEPEGALINEVMENSPAEKAGFEPGDVVRSYQGEKVADMAELRLRVAGTRPGEEAKFEIYRDGKSKTLTAKIGELQPDGELASSSSGSWGRGESDAFLTGVRILNLDEQTRASYRIPDDVNGVIVASVDPNSNAAAAGIRQGDVISAVGRTKIDSIADAIRARKNIKGDVAVLRVENPRGSRFVAVELDDK